MMRLQAREPSVGQPTNAQPLVVQPRGPALDDPLQVPPPQRVQQRQPELAPWVLPVGCRLLSRRPVEKPIKLPCDRPRVQLPQVERILPLADELRVKRSGPVLAGLQESVRRWRLRLGARVFKKRLS